MISSVTKNELVVPTRFFFGCKQKETTINCQFMYMTCAWFMTNRWLEMLFYGIVVAWSWVHFHASYSKFNLTLQRVGLIWQYTIWLASLILHSTTAQTRRANGLLRWQTKRISHENIKTVCFLHKNVNFSSTAKSHGIWAKNKRKAKVYHRYRFTDLSTVSSFRFTLFEDVNVNVLLCAACVRMWTFNRIWLFESVFTVKLVGIDAWNCMLALIHISICHRRFHFSTT